MGRYDTLSRSELRLLLVLRDEGGREASSKELKALAGINSDNHFYTALSGLRKKGFLAPAPTSGAGGGEGVAPVAPVVDTHQQAIRAILVAWNKAYPAINLTPAAANQLYMESGKSAEAVVSLIESISRRKHLEHPFGYIRAAVAGDRKQREEKEAVMKGAAIGEEEVYTPTPDEVERLREESRRARELIPSPSFDL